MHTQSGLESNAYMSAVDLDRGADQQWMIVTLFTMFYEVFIIEWVNFCNEGGRL